MIIDFFIDLIIYVLRLAVRFAPFILHILGLVVLPSILFVVYRIFAAIYLHRVAKMRGHEKKASFLLPLLLGIPGFIYVATLPDIKTKELEQAAKLAIVLDPEVESQPTAKTA